MQDAPRRGREHRLRLLSRTSASSARCIPGALVEEVYGSDRWPLGCPNPAGAFRDSQPSGNGLVERVWRTAVAMVGQVQWELIEPLNDESIYARFLAEKGEGVHHVGVAAPSFDETVAAQAKRGNGVVFSGEFSSISVACLAKGPRARRDHQILSGTPSSDLNPDATYP